MSTTNHNIFSRIELGRRHQEDSGAVEGVGIPCRDPSPPKLSRFAGVSELSAARSREHAGEIPSDFARDLKVLVGTGRFDGPNAALQLPSHALFYRASCFSLGCFVDRQVRAPIRTCRIYRK